MKVKDIVESVGTLSHKSTKHDKPYISPAENKKEREDLAKYKRLILSNFNKDINDDIFHGKLRLYIPMPSDYRAPVIGGIHALEAYRNELPENITMKFQGNTLNRLEMNYVFKDIQKALIRNGYTMENYIENKAVKEIKTQRGTKEQKTSISKALATAGDPTLVDFFNNDPVRTGSSIKDVQIVISRHPHDVGAMSTHRSWDSCMNLRKGLYRDKVPSDVEHGTIVAYLIDKKDRKVENPKARVAIKPFVNISDPTDVALGVEEKTYGQANPSFISAVVEWANNINATRVKGKGRFELSRDLYQDSQSYMLYGIDTDYPPDSLEYKLISNKISPHRIVPAETTPSILKIMLEMGYAYARITNELAIEHMDEYVKVFVDLLRQNRANKNVLETLVVLPNKDLRTAVYDQVYNQPFSQQESEHILQLLRDDPGFIHTIPFNSITPQMMLIGATSPYFMSSYITPDLYKADPHIYFEILKLRADKYLPGMLLGKIPKEAWTHSPDETRDFFWFCLNLENEGNFKYYFEMRYNLPDDNVHQIIEYLFQKQDPPEGLVNEWTAQLTNYPRTIDFNMIPDRYLRQYLPNIISSDSTMIRYVPDRFFDSDKALYDSLVSIVVRDAGQHAPMYIQNPNIQKYYEEQLKQQSTNTQVESIDRIKELVSYRI